MLAAGMGKRIVGITSEAPKVMLPLPSGRSLLAENLANAVESGVFARASVVTGHLCEIVEREVDRHAHNGFASTIHNPEYATAGPVRSLWSAREIIEHEDVAIANGDTYFRPRAFAALRQAATGDGIRLAYSRAEVGPDDVRVALGADGSIAAVGKGLRTDEADGISAGLVLAMGRGARGRLARALDAFMADGRGMARGVIWHDLVNDLATTEGGVLGVEVAAGWWQEVDTPEDYEALCAALRRAHD